MSEQFYQRALAAFRLRRWDVARKELAEELAKNPQNASALGLLAACSLNLGEINTAIEQARTAVKANPRQGYSHYILALSHMRDKQTFEAELAIEDALRIEPDNPDYLAVMASIHIGRRDYYKGLQLLARALAENPAHHYSLRQKYYVHLAQKRKKEAEEVRHRILELYPEDAEMHAHSGWQKLENPGEQDKALEHFEEALRLDPQADNYVEGLIEAKFEDQSAVARFTKELNKRRYRIFAFSFACVLIYLAACGVKLIQFSFPWFMALSCSSIILLSLAIFAKAISRAIYYSALFLSKEKRAALPKGTTKKVTSQVLGILAALVCFALGIFCQFIGITENAIPRWVCADWIPIVGRRYVLAVPLIFVFAVVGLVTSLPVVSRFHFQKRPRTTKYFTMLYIGIASMLVLALFFYVAKYQPGGWFMWFLLPFELALLIIPQTNAVREWVKGEIRKDQVRIVK